jgi:hypothetical protein
MSVIPAGMKANRECALYTDGGKREENTQNEGVNEHDFNKIFIANGMGKPSLADFFTAAYTLCGMECRREASRSGVRVAFRIIPLPFPLRSKNRV